MITVLPDRPAVFGRIRISEEMIAASKYEGSFQAFLRSYIQDTCRDIAYREDKMMFGWDSMRHMYWADWDDDDVNPDLQLPEGL